MNTAVIFLVLTILQELLYTLYSVYIIWCIDARANILLAYVRLIPNETRALANTYGQISRWILVGIALNINIRDFQLGFSVILSRCYEMCKLIQPAGCFGERLELGNEAQSAPNPLLTSTRLAQPLQPIFSPKIRHTNKNQDPLKLNLRNFRVPDHGGLISILFLPMSLGQIPLVWFWLLLSYLFRSRKNKIHNVHYIKRSQHKKANSMFQWRTCGPLWFLALLIIQCNLSKPTPFGRSNILLLNIGRFLL